MFSFEKKEGKKKETQEAKKAKLLKKKKVGHVERKTNKIKIFPNPFIIVRSLRFFIRKKETF